MSETPKYINLNGYPHGEPLWKTFHRSSGFRAGMLCSAFTMAVDVIANGVGNLMFTALPSLVLPTMMAAKYQVMEAYGLDTLFKTNLLRFPKFTPSQNLLIDTSPKKPMDDVDHIGKAKLARNGAIAVMGLYGSGLIAAIGLAGSKIGELSLYDICIGVGFTGQMIAPCLETWASSAQRFNKVVKGEYIIVDTPPQKQEERAPSLSFEPT